MASVLRAAVASLVLLSGAGLGRTAGLGESINRWVGQLGDDNFSVREQASQKLWAAGRAAEPALRAALKSKDPEAVRRARDLLDKLELGIAPDTPQEIINLASHYHAGDRKTQEEAVERLFEKGAKGYAVLMKLALREEPREEPRYGRWRLFEVVVPQLQPAAARLLVEGKADEAEELLRACVASETDVAVKRDAMPHGSGWLFKTTMQNYAALLLLRGRLDGKIAEFRSLAEQPWGAGAAELLVYLYQAKGNRPGARWAAERAGNPSLLTLLLEELGDWEALARQAAPKGEPRDTWELSRAAAYYRLAGDHPAFQNALAEIRRRAEAGHVGDVAPLFFLGRPEEALALLPKHDGSNKKIDLLSTQRRFRDAFALADEVLAKDKRDASYDMVSWAWTQYRLGMQEKAIELLTQVGGRLVKAEHPGMYSFLVEAEYHLGLKDQAFKHLAHILAKEGDDIIDLLVEADLFGPRSYAAGVMWRVLRRMSPKERFETTLHKLEDLLKGKMSGERFTALLKETERAVAQMEDDGRRAGWLGSLAQICQAAGRGDLAQQYWTKAAAKAHSAEPLIGLGDFLADQKRWQEAAEAYGQAWEKGQQQPSRYLHRQQKQVLPLYLRGWALTQAGREKEGRALMETAHWALLGNAEARYELARELSRRGLSEAARRERKLAFHLGWSEPRLPLVWGGRGSWVDDALRLDSADALSPQELRQAAVRCERILLATIGEGNCLPRPASFYLSGPHQVHFLRARAFAAEGRVKEALEEVQLCLAFLPGDVEMPICLVPELEKQGHKKEADELFGRVFGFYERLCQDYPRWAEGHNSLAWLAARCGRRLEEALAHSRRAVQLEPRKAAYLDTLAEVHFRRGDRARALELIKQCVELDPLNEAFRKQLKRFEAGGTAGTVPE